jgi:hypothetical protein
VAEPFTPHLIVLGSNATGRYFGSVFAEAEAQLALRAAGQMDLHTIRVVGEDLAALAADLPRGKVFEKSGNAFVPLAARAKVEKLMALGEAAGTLITPPKPEPATTPAGNASEGAGEAADGQVEALPYLPSSWADLRLGALVLCSEGEHEGWWEAVVVEIANEDDFEEARFTLSFRDFPGYERQVRRRAELALLPPTPASE